MTSEGKQLGTVYGVKRFSWFLFVPKFDMIRGVGKDYMHGALLGVVKLLHSLWLNKDYHKNPWSLSKQLKEIHARYLRMKPPTCITRLPRGTVASFGHLKASEFRTFLLFYSIPCLYGILPEDYLQHFILLFESIYLLLQHSMSLSDLKKASQMLKHFCLKMKELYGARYESYNVHCLLHLASVVDGQASSYNNKVKLLEDMYVLGTLKTMALEGAGQAIVESLVAPVKHALKFYRLLLRREVIYSQEYSRVRKRNSYTVEFTKCLSQQAFGEIEYFLQCFLVCPNAAYCSETSSCNKPVGVAIAREFMKNTDLKIYTGGSFW